MGLSLHFHPTQKQETKQNMWCQMSVELWFWNVTATFCCFPRTFLGCFTTIYLFIYLFSKAVRSCSISFFALNLWENSVHRRYTQKLSLFSMHSVWFKCASFCHCSSVATLQTKQNLFRFKAVCSMDLRLTVCLVSHYRQSLFPLRDMPVFGAPMY